MFLFSILVALGAALSFALAAVFQQEAARSADPESSLSLRLLLILLHRPKWLAGVGFLLCGYGLQALALSAGCSGFWDMFCCPPDPGRSRWRRRAGRTSRRWLPDA